MRPSRLLMLPALLFTAAALAAQQANVRDNTVQPRAVGTATISGRVIDEVTGQPVRRAVLSLAGTDRGARYAMVTGETGAFSFTNLPDGRFGMSANKPGYVGMSYGATRPNRPGTSIVLAAGQQLTGLTIRMPPGAVITGTVRDRSGEPLADARVSVLRQAVSYMTGERELAPAGTLGGFGLATNDRGEYRVYGLPAGEYYVVVSYGVGIRNESELREVTQAELDWAKRLLQTPAAPVTTIQAPEPGRAVEFAPMFYPGVPTRAAAAMVTVKAGEERSGVDVLLERLPTSKITGRVVMSTDAPLPPVQVNVIAHDTIPGIAFSGFGTARVDATGRFVSAGLPPGEYTITVRAALGRGAAAGSAALFGMRTVNLSGGEVDTTITLGTGVTVSGQLVFDGTTAKPPANLTQLRVNLTAERGRTPTLGVPAATVDATGAFKFVGVTPGRYRLGSSAPGGWSVRSASIQSQDTLDQPFEIGTSDVSGAEIRFTDLQTEISGDLLDTTGKPAPDYQIILYPADQKYWLPGTRRIQSVRPGADGHFRFQYLAPGDYMIAAVTDVEPGEWFDAKFLAQLVAASTKIQVAEGEKKTQSLRIKGS